MKDNSIPDELLALENRLRGQPVESPSSDFRRRLLATVDAELTAARPSSLKIRDSWYWITVAAAILIVMNFSLISASSIEFSFGPSVGPAPLTTELHALQTLENQMIGKHQ
jgi:hypothetical protein